MHASRLLLLALALGFSDPAPAGNPAPESVVVGIQASLDPVFFVETMGPTMAHLRKKLPDVRFTTRVLPLEALHRAVADKAVDCFMAESGLYAYEERVSGARNLAARTIPKSSNPSRSTSSTLVVRSDRTDLKSLGDLRGKRVAASDEASFDGWVIAQALLASEGFDPEAFWGEKRFTHHRAPGVVDLLLSGEADVGVLAACEFEKLMGEHNFGPSAFRIVNPQMGTDLACLRSAPLYPGVVFAALPHVPPGILKRLTLALLEKPASRGGHAWGIAGDYKGVDFLYRTLKTGPYRYLREMNWALFWEKSRNYLLAAAGVLLFWLFHTLRTSRLVTLRTRELTEALDRQKTLEKEAREVRQRLSRIERAGVLSQLSGMLAHEMLQPVAAIINYAGGLRMIVARRFGSDPEVNEAASVISEEARRIADIVEHVRSYAKSQRVHRERLLLPEVVEAAIRTFRASSVSDDVEIELDLQGGMAVEGDRLELELVLWNLLKNGAAAMKSMKRKRLRISTVETEGRSGVAVRDWGPWMTDEAFARLTEPVESLKPDGLGLGLSLSKTIAERHGGALEFERLPDGLNAVLWLPKEEEKAKGEEDRP